MGRYHIHAIICTDLDITIAIKLQYLKANSDSWDQDLFLTITHGAALLYLMLLCY